MTTNLTRNLTIHVTKFGLEGGPVAAEDQEGIDDLEPMVRMEDLGRGKPCNFGYI